jgi:alkanesulfonate monooxygenase SsuD/methylene tetrahydromethanopterin reductase-like flavin-dependent oxidoreductase (luciferase family)
MGAGGGRGTPYASEQLALGRTVPGDIARRDALEEAVITMRSVWSGSVAGVGGFLQPNPPPPITVGGFGPKVAELAGRTADGITLPVGPGLAQLLAVARTARVSAGRDPSSFIVTVSSDLRSPALMQLEELSVNRVVVFVGAPLADSVRRLAASQR